MKLLQIVSNLAPFRDVEMFGFVSKVARRLLEAGEAKYKQTTLFISLHKSDSRTDDALEEEDISTVVLQGLPEDSNKDMLHMLLENQKRSGGGKVLNLQIDDVSRTATVKFEDPTGLTCPE